MGRKGRGGDGERRGEEVMGREGEGYRMLKLGRPLA